MGSELADRRNRRVIELQQALKVAKKLAKELERFPELDSMERAGYWAVRDGIERSTERLGYLEAKRLTALKQGKESV